MRYMGGKNRKAKYIVPIISRFLQPGWWYVEPFVGGCGMMRSVEWPRRIGADVHEYIIAMWQALQTDWKPPTKLSRAEYDHIRENKKAYPKELVGFVGFGCSFGGKFFGGYAKAAKERDYVSAAARTVLTDAERLKNVRFKTCNYMHLRLPKKCVVYCDPPYANTAGYGVAFDSAEFWDWVHEKSDATHIFLVSEYLAPKDFAPLIQFETKTTLHRGIGKPRKECLFALA